MGAASTPLAPVAGAAVSNRRTVWRNVAALAFLLVVTAGFYWKLTISRDYTYLESPDLAIQVRPWLDYQAREFHAGKMMFPPHAS